MKHELDPEEAILSFFHKMIIRESQNDLFRLKGSDTWGKSPLTSSLSPLPP